MLSDLRRSPVTTHRQHRAGSSRSKTESAATPERRMRQRAAVIATRLFEQPPLQRTTLVTRTLTTRRTAPSVPRAKKDHARRDQRIRREEPHAAEGDTDQHTTEEPYRGENAKPPSSPAVSRTRHAGEPEPPKLQAQPRMRVLVQRPSFRNNIACDGTGNRRRCGR